MALLSKDAFEKISRILIKCRHIFTIVGIIFPLIYLSILSLPNFAEKTRISENALLPGLVDETWENHGDLGNFVKALESLQSGTPKKRRADYVFDELSNMGLEAYKQKFRSNITKITGTNVFGIIRASRATPAEAILVVVKLDNVQKQAISVALSLAKHSKLRTYWARDLIFLFVDGRDSNVGTLAWIQAYKGVSSNRYLWSEPLEEHSGTIVGSVVLDLSVSQFTHFDLKYVGINGLLPNLDLFNLFVRLSEKNDVKPYIQNNYKRGEYSNVYTLWRFFFSQAFNELEGIHSVLNQYQIHSITLKAGTHKLPHKRVHDFNVVGSILEGGLRSLNNILEKLHQSYFFYYLTSPHSFLSIAYYFPTVGLHVAILILHQFHGWTGALNLKKNYSTWPQATILSAIMYFSHIFVYNQYITSGSFVNEWIGYWSDQNLAAFILTINLLWPFIAAPKINSPTEKASVKYIHFLMLTITLLCVGLLNNSVGVYLGTYLLVSALISDLIPWNNFFTRLLYNIVMNPVTFHFFIILLASSLGVWPEELEGIRFKDISNPGKIAIILLNEGKRLLGSHLQYNAFNFLVFMLVSQQAHTVFISLIGF